MRQLSLLLISLFLVTNISAQKVIKDVKNNFNNFGTKITKVVIPGTGLIDLSIRDAVKKGWKISPYEFCTSQEYDKIKEDTSFYFLLRTDGIFGNEYEPRLEYLSLIKGGPKFKKGLFLSAEIISLPFQAKDNESGHILPFIPAYLDIMQNYIYKVQKKNLLAFTGKSSYGENLNGIKGKTILFNSTDIGFPTIKDEIKWKFRGRAESVTADEIEKTIYESVPDLVVSLVISPAGNPKGGYCYKLLIGAENHELYFIRKHKISTRLQAGFTKEDIKKISLPYQL
ncbi:MAG: hypothetical protein ABFC28_08515 [Rikenellaceae bacterium]